MRYIKLYEDFKIKTFTSDNMETSKNVFKLLNEKLSIFGFGFEYSDTTYAIKTNGNIYAPDRLAKGDVNIPCIKYTNILGEKDTMLHKICGAKFQYKLTYPSYIYFFIDGKDNTSSSYRIFLTSNNEKEGFIKVVKHLISCLKRAKDEFYSPIIGYLGQDKGVKKFIITYLNLVIQDMDDTVDNLTIKALNNSISFLNHGLLNHIEKYAPDIWNKLQTDDNIKNASIMGGMGFDD